MNLGFSLRHTAKTLRAGARYQEIPAEITTDELLNSNISTLFWLCGFISIDSDRCRCLEQQNYSKFLGRFI